MLNQIIPKYIREKKLEKASKNYMGDMVHFISEMDNIVSIAYTMVGMEDIEKSVRYVPNDYGAVILSQFNRAVRNVWPNQAELHNLWAEHFIYDEDRKVLPISPCLFSVSTVQRKSSYVELWAFDAITLIKHINKRVLNMYLGGNIPMGDMEKKHFKENKAWVETRIEGLETLIGTLGDKIKCFYLEEEVKCALEDREREDEKYSRRFNEEFPKRLEEAKEAWNNQNLLVDPDLVFIEAIAGSDRLDDAIDKLLDYIKARAINVNLIEIDEGLIPLMEKIKECAEAIEDRVTDPHMNLEIIRTDGKLSTTLANLKCDILEKLPGEAIPIEKVKTLIDEIIPQVKSLEAELLPRK